MLIQSACTYVAHTGMVLEMIFLIFHWKFQGLHRGCPLLFDTAAWTRAGRVWLCMAATAAMVA